MARGRKSPEEPRFEEALERLEAIARDLEEGDLSLEESLERFEEGVRLTRLCASRLEQAQRRIEILTRGEQGDLTTAPFEEADGAGEEESGTRPKGGDPAESA